MRFSAEPFASQLDGSVPLNLPLRVPVRWVAKRKAEVIDAVRRGAISLAEACRRYRLSFEEFHQWERDYDGHGLVGLRATGRSDRRTPRLPASSDATDAPAARIDCMN